MRKLVGVVLVSVFAVALAGCSQSHKTGDKSTLNFKESSTTVTTAAPTTTTRPAAAATTTPAKAPTTTAVKATVFTITIHPDGDASGSQFDPNDGHVAVGTVIKWVNADTVPRSVVSTEGKFTSPSIAPGASWTYTASAPGTYDYKDGTRPYALGKFSVG